jgi:predicted GTPase
MKKLPIIAIVGRANVGKSSLFNAILQRRETIVAKEETLLWPRQVFLAKIFGW